MSEFNNLKLEIADQTAVLSISRPAALNALNSETLDELNTALTEIEAMDDVNRRSGQEGQRVQVFRCRR